MRNVRRALRFVLVPFDWMLRRVLLLFVWWFRR